MADNESGGRRPPPPPEYRSAAKPPPTPAARMKTPPPAVAQPAESAPVARPLVEKQTFRGIVGDAFFAQFMRALKIICPACGFSIKDDFSTLASTLIFRGAEAAVFENGVMDLPLARLGAEFEVVKRILPSVAGGAISSQSLSGLSQIPPGLFLRISPSGIELRFRAAEEIAAPPAPVPDQKMLLAARRLLAKMGEADHSLSTAIRLQGNSILFKSGTEPMEISAIPESGGEVRLYLKDIAWGASQCNALLGKCGAPVSEAKLSFLFMHTHVYFRIRDNGFALCASNKRESEPSAYLIFQIA